MSKHPKSRLPLVFLIPLLIIAAPVLLYYFWIYLPTAWLNAVPLSPENYKPATVELVTLCQSDPTLYNRLATDFLCPFDPLWLPPSVTRLNPEGVDINPDRAAVTWGGGFYHCGWKLVRGAATANGYTWTLWFYGEGSPDRVLENIQVPASLRLTKEQFVAGVLAEINRRLAVGYDDHKYQPAKWYLPIQRCHFLEYHHRLLLLPAEIRASAAKYPHDWQDVLMAYLLDHSNPSAGQKLRQWANQTGGPGAWVYAAYAFYQAGDDQSGDAAVKKAIADQSPDPEWLDKEIPLVELGMAVRLYKSHQLAACAKLCDAILSTRHRYFKTRSSVQRMRDLAASPAASRPPNAPQFGENAAIDPFGGFDLNLLYVAATTSPVSARQEKLREMTVPNAWGTNGSIIDLDALAKPGGPASSISFPDPIVRTVDISKDIHRAILYDKDQMYDLGTLGGKNSSASAINAGGQIAGTSNISDGHEHAFLYEGVPGHGGHMIDLGVISGVGNSTGRALTSRGQVVGMATTIHPKTEDHAFIYQGVPGKDGRMVDLGTLGGSVSSAYAVNDAGQIVGQSTTASESRDGGRYIYHAFLYDGIPGKGGRMYDLGMLPGGGYSVAYDINASGEIVGTSGVSGHGKHAFRYQGIPGKGGRMIALPGAWNCEAYGINDEGYVVGNSDMGGIVWKPDGSIVNLRKWLAEVNPRAASHWAMLRPGRITNNGLIFGSGLIDDGMSHDPIFHSFILDASGLVSGAKHQETP